MTNDETRKNDEARMAGHSGATRYSSFGFPSTFDIRHSGFNTVIRASDFLCHSSFVIRALSPLLSCRRFLQSGRRHGRLAVESSGEIAEEGINDRDDNQRQEGAGE